MDYGFILDWLKEIQHLPDRSISALYFGIFETQTGYTIYLTGSTIYDPENDDWSVAIDYQPEMNTKYRELPEGIVKNISWQCILEICVNMLRMTFTRDELPIAFRNKIVTAGFDDGELIKIA